MIGQTGIKGWTHAPSDAACAAAWDEIARIAREHALVVSAAGGVMMLATPENQRAAEIRGKVLTTHRMEEP